MYGHALQTPSGKTHLLASRGIVATQASTQELTAVVVSMQGHVAAMALAVATMGASSRACAAAASAHHSHI